VDLRGLVKGKRYTEEALGASCVDWLGIYNERIPFRGYRNMGKTPLAFIQEYLDSREAKGSGGATERERVSSSNGMT